MSTRLPARPAPGGRGHRRRSLTLTELLVVIGVIVVILGLSIPARSVWEDRKKQEAVELVKGRLRSAYLEAAVNNPLQRRHGLFFYLDPRGRQSIWPIRQEPDISDFENTVERYVLEDVDPLVLPEGMRAVPLSVLRTSGPDHFLWSAEQLSDEHLRDPASLDPWTPTDGASGFLYPDASGTQYHRNFFVVLFSARGEALADERAYIIDADPPDYVPPAVDQRGDHAGNRTRLFVKRHEDDTSLHPPYLENAIIEDSNERDTLRFLSTSGVLVYEEAGFQRVAPADRFDYLRQRAAPLYIHPLTGEVIKGRQEGGPPV